LLDVHINEVNTAGKLRGLQNTCDGQKEKKKWKINSKSFKNGNKQQKAEENEQYSKSTGDREK
jgi:hypothetical protein